MGRTPLLKESCSDVPMQTASRSSAEQSVPCLPRLIRTGGCRLSTPLNRLDHCEILAAISSILVANPFRYRLGALILGSGIEEAAIPANMEIIFAVGAFVLFPDAPVRTQINFVTAMPAIHFISPHRDENVRAWRPYGSKLKNGVSSTAGPALRREEVVTLQPSCVIIEEVL